MCMKSSLILLDIAYNFSYTELYTHVYAMYDNPFYKVKC